jgi:hypothetical protein
MYPPPRPGALANAQTVSIIDLPISDAVFASTVSS